MMNLKKLTLRHIIIKMLKVKHKERILKAARESLLPKRESVLRSSADFLAETLQARREWADTYQVLKEKIKPTKNTLPRKAVLQN